MQTQAQHDEHAYEAMKAQLEAYVDKHGLRTVLNTIEAVCYDKSDHVATNWQDQGLAKAWEYNGEQVGSVKLKRMD